LLDVVSSRAIKLNLGLSERDFQIDKTVEVIRADHLNTVERLKELHRRAVSSGDNDAGFPVLREDHNGDLRMLGFIGTNELEHALSE
jgi:chloride channel 3/4/5